MLKSIETIDYIKLPKDVQDEIKEDYGNKGNNSFIKHYYLEEFKGMREYNNGEIFRVYENSIIERGDSPLTDYIWDLGEKEPKVIYILISW